MISWIRRRLAKADELAGVAPDVPTAAPESKSAPVELPHDKIASRAAEIWDRKGRPHGQDVQNWAEAEAELRAEFAAPAEPPPRKSR